MRHARDSNRRWPAVTEVHIGIRLGRDATFKGFSYAWRHVTKCLTVGRPGRDWPCPSACWKEDELLTGSCLPLRDLTTVL